MKGGRNRYAIKRCGKKRELNQCNVAFRCRTLAVHEDAEWTQLDTIVISLKVASEA